MNTTGQGEHPLPVRRRGQHALNQPRRGAEHAPRAAARTDLLALLDRELERHPEHWPELRPQFALAHQLHWLPPERLRELALSLAGREGIAR